MNLKTNKTFPFLLALAFLLPALSSAAGQDRLRKSVVKIFSTAQEPNYYEPWRVEAQQSGSGSGCVLPGNRILTNAHVVSNAIFIQVLKDGDTQKYTAKREFVAHDCDLAILKVDDPGFFKGTRPVSFGGVPSLRDKVAVYGYPVGGEELSITEGVVSRIELIPYSHSTRNLLGVQTDAAINPGNSGGPVFKKNKLVGVAFQGYNAIRAQNTGYLIPIPLIKRFLRVTKQGGSVGIPALGAYTESMENPSLRSFHGMKPGQSGVLVTRVIYGSSAWGQIEEKDVLMSIDGFPIANDGSILFRKGERIHFGFPLCLHETGDKLKMKILRKGKILSLKIKLKKDTRLVPYVAYDAEPSYFIHAGLIFSPLSANYMRSSKSGSSPYLMDLYYNGLPSENRRQVVLMSHIIPHEINKGYDSKYANLVVGKVNGVVITQMKDLIMAFEKPLDGRHVIEIEKPKEMADKIVLDASLSKKATEEILAQNNISSDRSKDLKKEK